MGARLRGESSIAEIARHLLALLPADGTPVLNRIMRIMLSREMKRSIEQEELFSARELLFEQKKIGRLRGQGGQIFLLPASAEVSAPKPETPANKLWPEAKLMAPLRRYLETQFRNGLELPDGAACVVEDTSTKGLRPGRWARPDFILVSAMRFKLMPGTQVDLHSFELKTEEGANDLAVYEALAQTRFTHFGHLVWHLPKSSKAERHLPRIEAQCSQHGIGLIRMCDPNDADSYEILLDPVRQKTLHRAIDDFLQDCLTEVQRKKIVQAISGTDR